MRAYNLCYTTLVRKSDIEAFGLSKEDDLYETSQGQFFINKKKREGLLPEILRELIQARKKAKRELAQT